jgi:hypothetical protein
MNTVESIAARNVSDIQSEAHSQFDIRSLGIVLRSRAAGPALHS